MEIRYDTVSLVKELTFTILNTGDLSVQGKLHPKDQPFSSNRPVAELIIPKEKYDGMTVEEILSFFDERIELDLKETYGEPPFDNEERDPEMDELKLLLHPES